MSSRQYSGSDGVPIKYRATASRQTEESPRYSYGHTTTRKQTHADDENDDAWTVEKPHTSAYRYDYPVTSPRDSTRDMRNPLRTKRVQHRRPLTGRLLNVVGLGLLLVILGVIGINALGNWWQRHTDDVTYGFPRTFQTDQYVGHGDSQTRPNHFVALNLNGIVVVLEVNPQHPQLDKRLLRHHHQRPL